MARYQTLIRGGLIVDGTGGPRFLGDIAIDDGLVVAVGDLGTAPADRVIEAGGRIVAPGVIDTHTHYDAQINWDPYCTGSGWHGMTTAVLANCGFGYAPVRPADRVRAMQMMVNTEQIPYAAQAAGLSWDWETFPQWLDHLRRTPKGVNIVTYVPMNPLMCYVMGVEAAKSRAATVDERRRMRELLHEAMDNGAVGFSFSYLGVAGNSHVDFDQSPMPTDLMAPEEAFNLCEVLRARGGGAIQLLSEMPAAVDVAERRDFVEQLALRSDGRVFDNVIVPIAGRPEYHRGALEWLDSCRERGLDIWMQSFVGRGWSEFNIMDMNAWDSVPVFRAMTHAASVPERLALVRSAEYRERLRREYDPERMYEALGPLEEHYVGSAGGVARFEPFVGKRLGTLAGELGAPVTDLFLDILSESALKAEFGVVTMVAHEPAWKLELAANPRVLIGSSDGGAHGKFTNVAYWSTDFIIQMVRETGMASLEEVHHLLSGQPAAAFRLEDRGTLAVGKAADIMIYDLERLDYTFGTYEVLHDQPGGEWRRVVRARGIDFILVNGEVTFEGGEASGAVSGRVLSAGAAGASASRPIERIAVSA